MSNVSLLSGASPSVGNTTAAKPAATIAFQGKKSVSSVREPSSSMRPGCTSSTKTGAGRSGEASAGSTTVTGKEKISSPDGCLVLIFTRRQFASASSPAFSTVVSNE